MANDEDDKFQRILDSCCDRVALTFGKTEGEFDEETHDYKPGARHVACISFSERGFGFGEITIVQVDDQTFIDTERMSLDRVKRYLCSLVDNAITDYETDPIKHKRYNEVRRRRCGSHCKICYPDSGT